MSTETVTPSNRPVAAMQERLAPYIRNTPTAIHEQLERDVTLYAKYESEQVTGSFKARGALAAMLDAQSAGIQNVVTASRGNHAAGVAYGAPLLGMHATIHVPEGTPYSKLNNTRFHGGDAVTLVEEGETFEDAVRLAQQSESRFVQYISPFDSHAVILGQATMTAELLQAKPDVDVIFLPVGGAGALAGAAWAVTEHGSNATVVGVQVKGNDSLAASMAHNKRRAAHELNNLCEGTTVRKIGQVCLEILLEHRDKLAVVTVDEADIGYEIVQEDRRRQELVPALGAAAFADFPETTGFVALAGARRYHREHPEIHDQKWAALVTGSNTDPGREARAVDAWMRTQNHKSSSGLRVASAQIVR